MAVWLYCCLYSLLKVVVTILTVSIRLHSIPVWSFRQDMMASVMYMVNFKAPNSSVFLAAWVYVMVHLAALRLFWLGILGWYGVASLAGGTLSVTLILSRILMTFLSSVGELIFSTSGPSITRGGIFAGLVLLSFGSSKLVSLVCCWVGFLAC